MTSKEATELRIKLERAGWKVKNGKFLPPPHLINKLQFSTKEAVQLQNMFGKQITGD